MIYCTHMHALRISRSVTQSFVERRTMFVFFVALVGAAILATIIPGWLPLIVLVGAGVITALAFFPVAGMCLLAALMPMSGWVINFGVYNWSRHIPILNTIDAPAADFFALVLLISYSVRLLALWGIPGREERPRLAPHSAVFWLFLFVQLLSVVFATREDALGIGVKYVLRPMLFMYLMWVLLPFTIVRTREALDRVLRWMYGVGVGGAVMGMISLILGAAQGGWTRVTPFALAGWTPFGTNHNLLAEVLVVILPIGAYLLHQEDRPHVRRWLFVGNALILVATLLTFARSAWIVLFVECLLALWLMRDSIGRLPVVRFRRQMVGLALALLLPILVYMIAISTSSLVAGSNDTRIDLARISWEYFRDRPLLGQGPGTFLSIVADTHVYVIEYGDPLDAHGMLQKIIAESGLLGLITWVLMLTIFMLYGWRGVMRARSLPEYPLVVALFVAASGAIVYQIFNTSYYSGKMWLPIGLLLVGAHVVVWKYRESKSFI